MPVPRHPRGSPFRLHLEPDEPPCVPSLGPDARGLAWSLGAPPRPPFARPTLVAVSAPAPAGAGTDVPPEPVDACSPEVWTSASAISLFGMHRPNRSIVPTGHIASEQATSVRAASTMVQRPRACVDRIRWKRMGPARLNLAPSRGSRAVAADAWRSYVRSSAEATPSCVLPAEIREKAFLRVRQRTFPGR